ncbi:hypothetical protein LH51_03570 [Nitrincola sp. A-D6]|uniref:DUF3080 family protein n=1 Tax=Nitrincola sp. A-D6 TaxID=1545442 RepID=UPI00051FCF70|nr:DUF3080 family protein [Nitrincola sp. A-D6]KGK42963.1 hypothetical protein LH51_03570 [Nitrincola sp. A-D6]
MWRPLSLLLLISLLYGCGEPNAEKMLQDYTRRVSNALDEPIGFSPGNSPFPAFPPRRERLLPVEGLREGLIDVLQLRHCDLLPLIAERNSNLGRVMTPSQTLKYELRFLPAVEACEQDLSQRVETDDTLVPLLHRVRQILQHKQEQLPRVIWNSIYTSEEMEQQFSRSFEPLPMHAQGLVNQASSTLDAFTLISQLVTQETPWPDSHFINEIEVYYEQLYRMQSGQQWLRSVYLLSYTMTQVTQAIEARLERRPICFDQQPNNRSVIIQNVFRNFYAAEFQPYLALTDQFGRHWQTRHQAIQQHLPLPPSSEAYFSQLFDIEAQDGVLHRFHQAREKHTQAWQTLLAHCGLSVGQTL